MKNFRFTTRLLMGAAIAFAAMAPLTSCSDDDDDDEDPTPTTNNNGGGNNSGNIVVSSNITTNTTWSEGNIYELAGRIAVESGATLIIEPGVIVKGRAGTGANATALIVARGASIDAAGTAQKPIIFTSVADQIQPGDTESPNLDPDQNGLWGGVIILGSAPISASNTGGDLSEINIEGIPTTDPNGLYGGNKPADNSGTFTYVSIRHGGANIGQGNEINGLSLGGVGSATTINNIEIVGNQDDGIEWFGGTVNVSDVVVWNSFDDAIDTDQAWSGTLDNFVIVTPRGSCFELDGPEGTASGSHTIQNGTVIASDTSNNLTGGYLVDVDSDSEVSMNNINFRGVASGQTFSKDAGAAGVSFTNVTVDVPAANLANYFENAISNPGGISAGQMNEADVSKLGWTWASVAGGLSGM